MSLQQLDADAFTYADGALATRSAGKWAPLSASLDLQVVSNRIGVGAADGVDVIAAFLGDSSNHWSQATMAVAGTVGGGPSVCSDAVNNAYLLYLDASTMQIYKDVAGVTSLISSVSATKADGDVLRLERQGLALITYKNDVPISSVSDGSLAVGKPGLWISITSVSRFDDWSGGDFLGVSIRDADPMSFQQRMG